MTNYLIRRLILIPVTLFCILMVNFVILNLAPGDPSTVAQGAIQGDGMQQAGRDGGMAQDDQYLLFREHYGLTKPILFNMWPSTKRAVAHGGLEKLADRDGMSPRAYNDLRIGFGDRSPYMLGHLLAIAEDESEPPGIRKLAVRFFVRGATRMGFVGSKLTPDQRVYNRKVAADNIALRGLSGGPVENATLMMHEWYDANVTPPNKVTAFFLDTRLARYLKRVVTLDFGTMRNDNNRTVLSEVSKRLKVSLTLAVLPMLVTFVLCQVIGFVMAVKHNKWPDVALNTLFLVLYAVPIFVVAPFLIEKVALTSSVFPLSGFSSEDQVYSQLTSAGRLVDISLHIFLPLVAIMYGTLAVQSRLTRTAVLEVLRQDYVRTARAKGVPNFTILFKHVGRNAAITVVTSLAASLGVILGGSLIVETIFGIDGFGYFFYQAIVNRDYNVILFSALAGAALTLIGYLLADIAYTILDPRVSLE